MIPRPKAPCDLFKVISLLNRLASKPVFYALPTLSVG